MTDDEFWDAVSTASRPPIVLPDIGTFFNQDMSHARALLDAVLASGTRCVKGELLHDADICLPGSAQERYLDAAAGPVSENYRELIERKTLPLADYQALFEPVSRLGLGLVLSVYDVKGADFARDVGACALKIASTNIVHLPLIRHCAKLGLPLLLDSGKSSLDELRRAVAWARSAGCRRLVVEYSPPAPPAPVEQHNLRALPKLQALFQVPVGLSDHHHGEEMLYAATTLGCRVLEKGVCDNAPAPDQDVFHALPVGELERVIHTCNSIFAALGQADAAYPEPVGRHPARMGLLAERALQEGEVLSPGDLRAAFPTLGIPVEAWDGVVGRSLQTSLAAGEPLQWTHLGA